MNNKFAVISDLHVGVHQASEKWLQEVVKFAYWLRDQLLDKNIKDIVIPGDFFHDRTDINLLALQYTAQILDIWKDFHIWMIPGNHDCFYKDTAQVSSVSILKGYSNVTIFSNTTVVDYNNKKIMFVPWGCSIPESMKVDIIVGHFELTGFKMNSFRVCETGDDSEKLTNTGNLIITGHFHLRQERVNKTGTILYVGTPYEMDYNDMDTDKGYHIIDTNTNNTEFVVYPLTTKHKKLSVTDLINNKDHMDSYLNDNVKGNVVTLVVDKEMDYDKISMLVQKIQTYQPFVFKGTDIQNTKSSDTVIIDQQVNIQTEQLLTEFVNNMGIDNSNDVLAFVLELYGKYKTC